jgi:hypothetical protein
MRNFTKFGLIVFIVLFNFAAFAQGDEDSNGNLEGNDPAPAPINSKLVFLAIAGIFFAIYTFRKFRKAV